MYSQNLFLKSVSVPVTRFGRLSSAIIFVSALEKIEYVSFALALDCAFSAFFKRAGIVSAAITPMIASVISTSARVNPFLR